MPNISRGNVAVLWFAERQKREQEAAAKKAAPKTKPVPDTSIYASPPWSEQEDAYVIKCYPTDGAKKVGADLGRTPRATQTRASYLGVTGPKILLRA